MFGAVTPVGITPTSDALAEYPGGGPNPTAAASSTGVSSCTAVVAPESCRKVTAEGILCEGTTERCWSQLTKQGGWHTVSCDVDETRAVALVKNDVWSDGVVCRRITTEGACTGTARTCWDSLAAEKFATIPCPDRRVVSAEINPSDADSAGAVAIVATYVDYGTLGATVTLKVGSKVGTPVHWAASEPYEPRDSKWVLPPTALIHQRFAGKDQRRLLEAAHR